MSETIQQGTQSESSSSDRDLIRSLNSAAAFIQNSIGSQDQVLLAFREQVVKLGLRGGISILDPREKVLKFVAIAYPPGPINEIISRVQKLVGLKVEGYTIPYEKIDAYRTVIEEKQPVFMTTTSKILEQLTPPVARPFLGQLLKLFVKTPGFYCPLIGSGTVFGMLNMMGHGLTRENLPEMTAFANHISAALENARLIERLKKSEDRFRTLVENSVDGVIIVQDGLIKYGNPRFFSALCYSHDEILAKPFLDLIVDDYRNLFPELLSQPGSNDRLERKGDVVLQCKNGCQLEAEITAKTIEFQEQHAWLVTIHDITERKKTEKELAKVQKLEAIGVLAGGLAHDFNNILAGIVGNLSLLQTSDDVTANVKSHLSDIEKLSLRGRLLTKQLLTFSKGGLPIRRLGPLGTFIKETADFTIRGLSVVARFEIPENLWHAEIDEGQISQAIINIVMNAAQAMPGGGEILVRAFNVSLDSENMLHLKPGNYVVIQTADKGPGIPPENIAKVLDPFFTTKPAGTGLGLSITYSILRAHHGTIDIQSYPGEGTCVSLYIPASGERAAHSPMSKANPISGTGRILVMDDEEVIRTVTGRMLQSIGYQVELFGDGESAVHAFRAATGTLGAFNAVILDLTIPGKMGGIETVKRMREIASGVKAIVSSGYADGQALARYEDFGFCAVLPKPFTMEELGDTVRRVIKGG